MAGKNWKNNTAALNIYLTGFMCAGKTSTGKALGRLLKRKFLDSDLIVEKKAGIKIAAMVEKKGLGTFRKAEAHAVRKISARSGLVAALGGGVYPSLRWKKLLNATGLTVYLHCPWPELEKRLKAARGPRPLLGGRWEHARMRAKKLYAERLPLYRLSDLEINTNGLTPPRTAALIARKIRLNFPGA